VSCAKSYAKYSKSNPISKVSEKLINAKNLKNIENKKYINDERLSIYK
jgi:hypothetical protein